MLAVGEVGDDDSRELHPLEQPAPSPVNNVLLLVGRRSVEGFPKSGSRRHRRPTRRHLAESSTIGLGFKLQAEWYGRSLIDDCSFAGWHFFCNGAMVVTFNGGWGGGGDCVRLKNFTRSQRHSSVRNGLRILSTSVFAFRTFNRVLAARRLCRRFGDWLLTYQFCCFRCKLRIRRAENLG